MLPPAAGEHHNHGHGGAVEVSEAKVDADQPLIAGVGHEHGHEQLHACIGVSLVLGFVFMLLVDQIGSSHMHNNEGPSLFLTLQHDILTVYHSY